jgi:hypothetical protein
MSAEISIRLLWFNIVHVIIRDVVRLALAVKWKTMSKMLAALVGTAASAPAAVYAVDINCLAPALCFAVGAAILERV